MHRVRVGRDHPPGRHVSPPGQMGQRDSHGVTVSSRVLGPTLVNALVVATEDADRAEVDFHRLAEMKHDLAR